MKPTPKEDLQRAEAFFKKYDLSSPSQDQKKKAIAELAHTFWEERTRGHSESVLDLRVTMGDIAQKAMRHISDECLELLINHNGRNMVLTRAPRKKKKG